jgi:hypothetical protein
MAVTNATVKPTRASGGSADFCATTTADATGDTAAATSAISAAALNQEYASLAVARHVPMDRSAHGGARSAQTAHAVYGRP